MRILRGSELLSWLSGRLAVLAERNDIDLLERYHERMWLYSLLDDILAKSKGEFQNRDQVFEVFARANFSRNLLPLARLVEKTLGKKMLRKIGNYKVEDSAA